MLIDDCLTCIHCYLTYADNLYAYRCRLDTGKVILPYTSGPEQEVPIPDWCSKIKQGLIGVIVNDTSRTN